MHLQRRSFLAAMVAVLVAGCGSVAPSPRSATPGSSAAAFAVDRQRLEADLEALQAVADANGGVRTAGTPGYEASVDRVAAELRDIGFAVETPTVEFTGFRELPGGILEVGGETFAGPDELHALIYSPGGDIRGPVEILENSGCDPEDFAGVPEGAVALTTLGGCFRRDQAINAGAAGVAALLVGYPGRGPGEIFRPTLIDPGGIEIPVVSVTDAAVEALTGAVGDDVHLVVETEREPATLRNVIAQLGDGPSIVMIGAHLDSVLDGPGINDNGSGVAAVLEIARGMAASGVPDGWALRVGLWGGEEFGTIGSRAYTREIGDEVAAYLNLDMAGSVNGATLVYDEPEAAPGSERITEAFEAWLSGRGEESHRADLGGSSDHFGFREAGIPTGGLFAGASESGSASQPSGGTDGEAMDPCYHLACDDIDNVDVARVALFAEATLAVALELMDVED
jgi:Zn-dependent M28 family amino/carboxypeptidase